MVAYGGRWWRSGDWGEVGRETLTEVVLVWTAISGTPECAVGRGEYIIYEKQGERGAKEERLSQRRRTAAGISSAWSMFRSWENTCRPPPKPYWAFHPFFIDAKTTGNGIDASPQTAHCIHSERNNLKNKWTELGGSLWFDRKHTGDMSHTFSPLCSEYDAEDLRCTSTHEYS